MPRLALMRHAKAAPQGGGDDHGRPLALRGLDEAPRMGAWLNASGFAPALTLVSDARRTRETFDLVARCYDAPLLMRLDPRLYMATAQTLLAIVRSTPANVPNLLLIGHNPALAELALQLAGGDEGAVKSRLRKGFPPASLAILDLAGTSWSALAVGLGRFETFVTPLQLGGEGE